MADREEQYVLRVQDKAVAARIRKQLNQEHSKAKLDIRLDGASACGRAGRWFYFVVGSSSFAGVRWLN